MVSLRFLTENNEKTPEEIRELSEQFTIQGFIAVSFWALAYSMLIFQALAILDNFGWYKMNNFLKTAAIIYGITWFLCFLFMCLIPKLKGEK